MKSRAFLRRTGLALALVGLLLAVAVTAAGAVIQASPVKAGGVRPDRPAVSGQRVVWADYRRGQWDIWLYDAAEGSSRQLTSGTGDKVMPSISGDNVVYVGYGQSTDGDVYLLNLVSGTTTCLSVSPTGAPLAGDQLNPTIYGKWVAWEDYSNGYQSKIMGYDLESSLGFQVELSGGPSGWSKKRPQLAGDIVVFEDYPTSKSGSADVIMFNMRTKVRTAVAATTADERMPSTDGTWISWMQWDSVSGYDIYAYDIRTGVKTRVAGQNGEQALPVVGNGTVYWVDAAAGGADVKSAVLDGGSTTDFAYASGAQVAGLNAQGDGLAWLQQVGSRWQVRALFGTSAPALLSARTVSAAVPVWNPFDFAVVAANDDLTGPSVMRASVKPGQRKVKSELPLRVYFSEDMDPGSMTARNVRLVNARTKKPVAAAIGYSATTRSAVVTPRRPLSGEYALVVGRGVKDRAGNTATNDLKVAFTTLESAALGVYPPGYVSWIDATVIDATGRVRIDWTPTTDDIGVTGYYVKRYSAPIDGTNFATAPTLTPEGAGSTLIPSTSTSAVFLPAADEKAKKHTYFYTVYAVDGDGMTSTVLYNISPDPHGGQVLGKNTINCNRCHSTHGAVAGQLGKLAARGAKACYKCHGETNASAAAGANSVNNIQAQFWDYAAMPATASRHGNAYIRANDDNQQCDMCHAPHYRPYRDDSTKSYGKMLWTPKSTVVANWSTDASGTTPVQPSSNKEYSKDSAPFADAAPVYGETFCLNCHGGSSYDDTPTISGGYAFMYGSGGPTAYDDTAGDHNSANWRTATAANLAHGVTRLPDTARAATPNGGAQFKSNCQVCHNEHGSESKALLDRRRSGDTTMLAQSGMCLECHSATDKRGAATVEAGAPNTWWAVDRDIRTEFNRKNTSATGSAHPTSVEAPTVTAGSWSATTDTDFGLNAATNTEVTGTGSAASLRLTQTVTAPQTGLTAGIVPVSTGEVAGSWTTTPLWSKIDEYPTANNTDYVVGTNTTECQFTTTSFSVPAGATNIVVQALSTARDATAGTNNYFIRWRTGGTWRSLPTHDPAGTTFAATAPDTITEPGDGVWTPAEVNAIDGLGLDTTDASPNPWVGRLALQVTYDIPGTTTYATTGSSVSPVIAASGTMVAWGQLNVSGTVPANTSLVVDVLNGATDAPILTGLTLAQMPYPLAPAVNAASVPTIKLRARMTGDGTTTSLLNDWSVGYTYMPAGSGQSSCASCHNAHYVGTGGATAWDTKRMSDPINTKVALTDVSGDGVTDATDFCLRCHANSSYQPSGGAISIPSVVNANTLRPYGIVMRSWSAGAWPFFNGWYKGEFTQAGHYTATAAQGEALCQNCHDPHGSNFKSLTAWTKPGAGITGGSAGTRDNTTAAVTKEENLCFQCHGDGTTANKGKAAGAPNVYTPAGLTYTSNSAHGYVNRNVADKHSTSEGSAGLGVGNRHAECGDCHDPHSARAGVHTAGSSTAGAALRGAVGVVPTWPSTVMGTATSYATERIDAASDYEAYLCLKCHSSYTTLPTTGGSGGFGATDLAAEFNPNNASGHNVMGDDFTKDWTGGSANTWTKPASLTLAAGWNVDSPMTCTDCHTSPTGNARGPHGSSAKYMLKWGGTTDWYTNTVTGLGGYGQTWSDNTGTFFCGGCHTSDSHGSWMNRSDHTGRACSHCHAAIPHGWKRPRLLVYTSDSAPYKVTTDGNLTGILRTNLGDNFSNKSDCKDSCAGDHSGTGTYW